MSHELLPQLKQAAAAKKKAHQKLVRKLAKEDGKKLDREIHQLHEEVFACTDCLQCANCCKTTGPLFTRKDIDRISKHLKMKAADFEEKYLRVDEDGDHVLQSVPCTFLGEDNYCSIYDVRPKACREYPHTDRDKQQQILHLTRKNASICPAVFTILERVLER
ncbi:YkgJ family cysteine cluster protein [Phaeocystidibacter marisrubri]|uniref:YkgJ family cysteine cluster protein n=1 Tax=Phaeocystidibacter marisrubri TaxID=1577780 RepID=A0A6L3ZJA9_9FLAO|nr:YkgJ family cysteine cluster protein [Phaeocystidibacter marisrubri]KAB2817515.1 YkgJ family cysteine cluster protein [Phaeocystidibacter marisrubri]GGH74959.1 zinc/iron-chelating domain-containing protein [Phaeocystidibacter marisrubri]